MGKSELFGKCASHNPVMTLTMVGRSHSVLGWEQGGGDEGGDLVQLSSGTDPENSSLSTQTGMRIAC